jgi:hypothetical protein
MAKSAFTAAWVKGDAYVKKVNEYGPLYQPTVQSVIIPAIEGSKLAGSYQSFLVPLEKSSPLVEGRCQRVESMSG